VNHQTIAEAYITKAKESLASAASDLASGRFNSCASRAYFASFQAAVSALIREGVLPANAATHPHATIHAQFASQLVNRRKIYPAHLRDTLGRLMPLRHEADYDATDISGLRASRGLERATEFVNAIALRQGSR
jgi:uncharacterized protein (UPF0332 family)